MKNKPIIFALAVLAAIDLVVFIYLLISSLSNPDVSKDVIHSAFFTGTTTATHYTFTGLTGLTTYYVWVYANCAEGMSDYITAATNYVNYQTINGDPVAKNNLTMQLIFGDVREPWHEFNYPDLKKMFPMSV